MRRATDADIPGLVEYAKEMHGVLALGEYDPEYCAQVAAACRTFVNDHGMLGGMEMPVSSSPEPAINHVVFWNSTGAAWDLLAAHEAASPLPSTLAVPAAHPRSAALVRALRGKGYREHEIMMVKR